MKNAAQPKPRLTRQDWLEAAFELLTQVGIGEVSIERLATRLGVTRGSFYHHLRNREDLLRAVLEYWAQRWTYAIRDQVEALGLDPGTTLLALMNTIRSNRAAFYDAAFRAWALQDPLARETLEKVDGVRLGFIQSQFEALGFTGLDAETRARLFLNYFVAEPAMFAGLSPEKDEKLLKELHRFLTTASVV